MLGRYVAGTVLILGAAMVIAPEAPEPAPAEVSRAENAPLALAGSVNLRPDPVRLIDPKEALAGPEKITVDTAVAEPAAKPSVRITSTEERVILRLPGAQIGGIAALAGLEAQPTTTTTTTTIVTEPLPKAEPAAAAPVRDDYFYVTGSRVNVRSGPSTDYRVIGRAVYGDSVEILSRDGDGWAEVRILGTEDIGYMSADFLAPDLNG